MAYVILSVPGLTLENQKPGKKLINVKKPISGIKEPEFEPKDSGTLCSKKRLYSHTRNPNTFWMLHAPSNSLVQSRTKEIEAWWN